MRAAILARHGESVFSVAGRLNGDTAVAGGLTPLGVEQARALGEQLRGIEIDLAVTSQLERAIQTADEALRGRDVPRIVMPELNDPLYGPYEGGLLEDYRAWASSSPSSATPGDGGESRYAVVRRYTAGFRHLLGLPEPRVAVFAHSLPIAYALAAQAGDEPGARMPLVAYATPYGLTAEDLRRVVTVLEEWLAAPTF